MSLSEKMTKYRARVAEIEEAEHTGRYAEYRKSVGFRLPEVTILQPPCGCSIEGDGNLQSPMRIKFCTLHACAGCFASTDH